MNFEKNKSLEGPKVKLGEHKANISLYLFTFKWPIKNL